MENIIETENITLDFDESRPLRDVGEYRITLYDKYGHYDDCFYLSSIQMLDIIEGMKGIKIEVKKDFL